MVDLTNPTPRRGFLGTMASGAIAAIGIAGLAGMKADKVIASPLFTPPTQDTSGFGAWLGKMTGKHRQVFDAPGSNEGMPLAWTRVFLSTHNEMGTPDSDLTAVVILRHAAIPLAMGDALWTKYKFGEVFKITDAATKAPALRNVYANVKPGELPFPDMSVDQLQKRGVLFGVCNMAITFYSMKVAEGMKMAAEDVKKDWIAGLLPGIQLVPSGVLAVNMAQEHGCTYCYGG